MLEPGKDQIHIFYCKSQYHNHTLKGCNQLRIQVNPNIPPYSEVFKARDGPFVLKFSEVILKGSSGNGL